MGDTITKWDNGLYVDCHLLGTHSTFLIDSGSTATLLSDRVYFSIEDCDRPTLTPMTQKVKGANGVDIDVQGYTDIMFELGGGCFKQSTIVCDILPDGVLGQDFLLKYASRIDYKRLLIDTSIASIPCWIGGETEAISRVLLVNTTIVPPFTTMLVDVELPNFDKLSGAGLVTRSSNLIRGKDTVVVEGVIDTTERLTRLRVINVGENEAKLFPSTPLGTCESFYDTTDAVTEPAVHKVMQTTRYPEAKHPRNCPNTYRTCG